MSLTPFSHPMLFFPIAEVKASPIPILVTLRSVMKDTTLMPAVKEIMVGCVRTMAVSQKKVCFP